MLSILEVCQLTGKSEKTIYRMMNNGVLAFTQKDGKRLIDKDDALSLIPHSHVKEIEKKDAVEQKLATLTKEVVRLSELVEQLIDSQKGISSSNQKQINQEQNLPSFAFEKKSKLSSNEIRAQKARKQLFDALDDLKEKDRIPTYRDAPSITGIHKITGIDRGTISKYIQEWIDENL